MRIGLQWKVVLTIVAVGILPLAGGLFWAGQYGQSTLIKASGEKFTELAKQMANHINFLIDREIHEAQSLALSEQLQRSVTSSNVTMAKNQSVPVESIQSLMENPASSYLQAYQRLKENEYEIIFATDRHGRVVASTRLLEHKSYDQEPWWQAAYHGGKGAVFISDLYTGREGDSLQVDLALPILDRETRHAIGVLKFVIKDLELEEILQEVKVGRSGHAMLLGEGSRIWICPLFPTSDHQPVQINIDQGVPARWSIQENGHGGEKTVVAFALVPLTTQFGPQNFGIKPWWVVITQSRSELFAPIHQALWVMSGLGGVLIALLVLLGVFAGKRLVRPILTLQQGAEILAGGNLGHRLKIKTHDEIELLASTINHMAESLQQRSSDLLAARDYLKNIIEQSAVLIITTHPTYEIREFNRGAEEILGYQRNQIIGNSLELIWDDPEEFRQVITQITSKGQRIHYETAFARSDGTPVQVSFSLIQLTDQTGNVLGLVVVGEDITQRKQFEESRLKAERLMALHRLSTVLTHDLRSPMMGILKALAVLQGTYSKMPEDQAQQLLSDLLRGGNLLLGTLNDLLDVYRHSLSALPLRYTDFVLSEAVEEIIRLINIDAQARGVKLEVKIALPEMMLSADRRRIQRVIFNLLDNAIKYSPPGCLVTLHVSAPAEGLIHLQIEDQGPGIPDGEFSRIFDFLYETPGDQTDRVERSGIGVGLYFCRMTVEAHGGRMWAENRSQGGARFTVCLPLASQQSVHHGSKS